MVLQVSSDIAIFDGIVRWVLLDGYGQMGMVGGTIVDIGYWILDIGLGLGLISSSIASDG